MSLIEKIDAEIAEADTTHIGIFNALERDIWNNGYNNGIAYGLQQAKEIILSEKKEPCEYCTKTSKIEMFIHDTVEDCKWCDKEKCDNYDDSCYGIGYGVVPQKFCPVCGRPLNQPIES